MLPCLPVTRARPATNAASRAGWRPPDGSSPHYPRSALDDHLEGPPGRSAPQRLRRS